MRSRRWASTVRHKFQLALLVPARPCVAWRQRSQWVRAEPVRPFRSSQKKYLNDSPQPDGGYDQAEEQRRVGVVEPILELVEETRDDEKRDHPPGAFVAVMQPLDRGGDIDPQEQRRSHRLET